MAEPVWSQTGAFLFGTVKYSRITERSAACYTDQLASEMGTSAFCGCHPVPHGERRIVAHMLDGGR
jgi:hypothetical protein